MTIILKRCTSEINHLSRTFEEETLTLEGIMRDESSVSDPTILVEYTADLPLYNYMEIPDFGRSYFFSDNVTIVNGMWVIRAHVDVIGTWLEDIKASEALINEREKNPDYYVDDGHSFLERRKITQIKKFDNPDGYYKDDNGKGYFDPSYWEYVLITQGPGADPTPAPSK